MTVRQQLGQDAEKRALAHLSQQGLRLLARNWRCRLGELDLVMLDGDTVVFIEVRYRSQMTWGSALESVNTRKQHKVIKAAQLFLLQENKLAKRPCRFDVVAIDANTQPEDLVWIRNAFDG